MKKITLLFTTVLISVLLSSCMTAMLWNVNPVSNTKQTFHLLKEDQIAGFAKVIQKNEPTKFIVIGQNYAYLIEGGSDQINTLLSLNSKNTTLEIVTNSTDGLRLTVKPEQKENYEFEATLGFNLTAAQPTLEQTKAFETTSKNVNLKANLVEREEVLYLTTHIPIQGKIVLLNDKMKATKLENMSKVYPVKIGYYSTKKSISVGNLFGNIIETPFVLVADAIITPIAAVTMALNAVVP